MIACLMTIEGPTIRRITRLILQILSRPIVGPIHINLEEDGVQINDVEGNNVEDKYCCRT